MLTERSVRGGEDAKGSTVRVQAPSQQFPSTCSEAEQVQLAHAPKGERKNPDGARLPGLTLKVLKFCKGRGHSGLSHRGGPHGGGEVALGVALDLFTVCGSLSQGPDFP